LNGGGSDQSFVIEGRPTPEPDRVPVAWYSSVTTGYHEAMGIPLLKGRLFTERDNAGSPLVVVVNRTMAQRYWPDEDPIGKRIGNGSTRNPRSYEIIGIVGNIRFFGLDKDQPPAMYFPMQQSPSRAMSVALRTAVPPATLASAARQQIWALDRNLSVSTFVTMEELVSRAADQPRLLSALTGSFAAIALLLASIGLYGVMRCAVSERTHEIGVRMALGAAPGQVRRMVLGQGLKLVMIGMAIGLAASLAFSHVLETLLFQTGVKDSVTFTAVALLLLVVGFAASYFPARRATLVDPLIALRCE
jgi:putative ABC transport system permease protein